MAQSIQSRPPTPQTTSSGYFVEQYQRVRRFTEQLCDPLVTEDYVIQSMPDVSPTKWHLAHVSWFFETFLLSPAIPGYQSCIPSMHTSLTPTTITRRTALPTQTRIDLAAHCRRRHMRTEDTSTGMSLSYWKSSMSNGWRTRAHHHAWLAP